MSAKLKTARYLFPECVSVTLLPSDLSDPSSKRESDPAGFSILAHFLADNLDTAGLHGCYGHDPSCGIDFFYIGHLYAGSCYRDHAPTRTCSVDTGSVGSN